MVEMTNPVNAYNYSPLYSKSSDSITPSVDGDIGANSHQPGADGPPSFELEGYELFGRNDVLHTNASAILTSTTRVLSPSSVKDSKHSNEGDDKHFMQAFLETQNTPITEEIPYSLPREKEKEKPIIKQEYQSTIPNCNTSNSDTTHHSNGRSRSGRMIKRVATMEFQDNREMKMIKLALSNSIVETKIDEAIELPQAHVFFPTLEEFAEPIKYISSIQELAIKTGICKIVPPKGWNPPFAIDLEHNPAVFNTRLQHIHRLQEGRSYEDGQDHTFHSYKTQADLFRREWLQSKGYNPETVTSAEIEREYWRIIQTGAEEMDVEYANDLDTTEVGSGFLRPLHKSFSAFDSAQKKGQKESINFQDPEYYRTTGWNLNNLPRAYGSLLRHIQTDIKGINVPWLYCGMLFATFCWHTEDNYMYSINYQHYGAKKRWYGVPASHSSAFEKALMSHVPERFKENPDLLFHLVTMIPPSALVSKQVEVYTLIQEPGDIIVTFPRGYHGGYSEGFNVNEAVNFILPGWIPFSRQCVERYREHGRSSIFSLERIMFHLGSSASLEEFSILECEFLLNELRTMFQEEQRLKKDLQTNGGLVHCLQVDQSAESHLDHQSMQKDDLKECCICKHTCFFTSITCPCSPTKLACLRHARILCKDPLEQKTLIQWIQMGELKFAIRRVQEKIRTLKNQEQKPKDTVVISH